MFVTFIIYTLDFDDTTINTGANDIYWIQTSVCLFVYNYYTVCYGSLNVLIT